MRQLTDCDKLLKAVEGGNFEEIDAIMKQMENSKLLSAVSHLVLQLMVCYDYASLVESLLLQYKVQKRHIRSMLMCVCMCI